MDIKITGEYITLGQLLKMTDFIQSGGEAKFAVKSLKINVNGEQENRRGRKHSYSDRKECTGKDQPAGIYPLFINDQIPSNQ